MAGPLSHIRVLDLSRVMAGPWATQLLADLGADVIKIERPGPGDDTRAWGPPFLKTKDGSKGDSGYFLSVNRGKRSVAVDLATPEGQAIIRAIAARSDVVIENFKVGALARYGLDYQSLKSARPDMIYCSVTGFGQTGPRAEEAAYDFMIQGMSGLMSITGKGDETPGGGPMKIGLPMVDIMTGMYSVIGILAALQRRSETGKGERIDIAMLDVGMGFLANQAMNYFLSGNTPKRTGNAHPNIQPQDVFPCRDGHIIVAVGNDSQFARFCEAAERPEIAKDERYATNEARVKHYGTLNPLIIEILSTRDLADWLKRFAAVGVPSGPINTVPMAFAEEQSKHREMRIELPHPTAGSVPLVANPIRFSEAPIDYTHAPPLVGQHTEEVLRELGILEPAPR